MRKVLLPIVSALVTALSLVAPSPAAATVAGASGCTTRVAGAAAAAATTTVWMAGDSTMANPSAACPVGWATEFDSLFHSNIVVNNLAVAGRSIQTWLYEGNVTSTIGSNGECVLSSTSYSSRWQQLLTDMKAGDYLFIQFGINDGSTTCPRHVGTARYQALMTMMAQAAQARGAHPVLLTAVAAITCSGSTAVRNRGFVPQTTAAGAATGSPVIDLQTLSVDYYNSLGLCPNNGDYTSGLVGQFFCNDHTHFEAYGARRIARLVTGALRTQNIPLAGSLL
ncbi:carbohydrate esterase [Nonomuraea zeae]|uniref:Carbohydrate esterase n=1 Tax=Nonomuraea zeae TaxID=1642303 RepID=A0A5S4H3B2_9ACTN|nr:carbohydrate esterase [Nonomuraea zeae]TMR39204.1 carbohydrate esterase [Nonomuraea zeae]